MSETLGKFGHHPDPQIDAEVEIDKLTGLLSEAHAGLIRALDYRAATPEGLSIKRDIRNTLERTGRPAETWGAAAPPVTPLERCNFPIQIHELQTPCLLAKGHQSGHYGESEFYTREKKAVAEAIARDQEMMRIVLKAEL
jgi:hypothetical protein